mgnify:CR=1 FL=1
MKRDTGHTIRTRPIPAFQVNKGHANFLYRTEKPEACDKHATGTLQIFFNQHYTIPTWSFTLIKVKKRRVAGPLG